MRLRSFIVLAITLILVSCKSTTRVVYPEKKDKTSIPEIKNPERPDSTHHSKIVTQNKKDSVGNEVIKPDANPEVIPTEKTKPNKHLKSNIKVAVALPMKGGYDVSRFVEFVNGMSLAGSLSGGTSTDRLDIHFMDIGNDNSAEKLASIKAILDADIILGGYQTSQVKALAEIALSKAIPYISLWNSSDDIVNHNPYFFQMKPSLEAYCSNMASYITKQLRPDLTIILLEGKNTKDASTIDYFSNIYQKERINFKVVYGLGSVDWQTLFMNYNRIVVNIPNWDERQFVKKALKQLIEAKKNKNLTVTGMPQWASWDQADFTLFENCGLLVPIATSVDLNAPEVIIFQKNYFEKYGTWPTSESFYGNDILYLIKTISSNLMKGDSFEPVNGYSAKYFSSYEFRPVVTRPGGEVPQLSYYRNQSITIEKFEGGRFVTVR